MRVRRARWPLKVALVIACLPAVRAGAQDCTFIAEGTTWLWQLAPGPPGWADPGEVDDPEESSWQLGCAPFSSTGCGFAPGTYWMPNTNLVVRQHVFLTGAESDLVANIAIDNDFELHVNGSFVSALSKENCATRWDARVPIPDALWVPGDNVVALRVVDRGGISNFEMTLTGLSPEPCPSGCALLPCDPPGPAIVLPVSEICPGQLAALRAEAPVDARCPTELEYRFRDAVDGRLLRGWGDADWWGFGSETGLTVTAEARCAHSPTCPVTIVEESFPPRPGPPLDPGPVLRVGKPGGSVRVSWETAPPLGAGEHEHLWMSSALETGWSLANGEANTASAWVDFGPEALRHYRLRRADACERESPLR